MSRDVRKEISKIPRLERQFCKLKNEVDNLEIVNSLDNMTLDSNYLMTINYTDRNGSQTINVDLSPLSMGETFKPDIVVNNYTDLQAVTGQELFEFAEVTNPQGTPYLPGSLGGNYYASGLYYWNGTVWKHDNDEILKVLSDLITADTNLQTEIDEVKLSTGWWNITDTTFIESSPQTISSGVRTKLQINSDSVINGFGANNQPSADIWDDVNNKITPLINGDSYIFRLSLTANPTLNNRNFTVDLDIGGTQNIIFERTTRLARGANTNTKVSMTNSIFTLGTFIANGGEIYITCDGDVEIFDISLFIQKVTEND